MCSAIQLPLFQEAVGSQFVFTIKLYIFTVKQVNDLFFLQFITKSIGSSLHDIAKFRMHFLRQSVTDSMLQHKSCAAFTGLAVDTDNRFVFTAQISRIDRKIRYFPIRSIAFRHIFVTLTYSILMRTGERGKRQFTRIRLALGHLHLGTGLINFFDRQNIGKIKLRINALSIHIQSNCHNIKIASALAVAKQCSFDAVCSAQQGKFSRSNTCPAVIMRMNADNSSFPVFHLSTEIFDLIRICVRR